MARGQRQRALLTRNGTTITREGSDYAYIIYCQRCDFMSRAVSARGMLPYRDAVKLANRHSCEVLDLEY